MFKIFFSSIKLVSPRFSKQKKKKKKEDSSASPKKKKKEGQKYAGSTKSC